MACGSRRETRRILALFRDGNLLLEEAIDLIHWKDAKGGDATTPPDTGT